MSHLIQIQFNWSPLPSNPFMRQTSLAASGPVVTAPASWPGKASVLKSTTQPSWRSWSSNATLEVLPVVLGLRSRWKKKRSNTIRKVTWKFLYKCHVFLKLILQIIIILLGGSTFAFGRTKNSAQMVWIPKTLPQRTSGGIRWEQHPIQWKDGVKVLTPLDLSRVNISGKRAKVSGNHDGDPISNRNSDVLEIRRCRHSWEPTCRCSMKK